MNKENQAEVEQLRQALQEKTEELETIKRELDSFSYSVSHDLRAPLRAIEGFSKILLEDYPDKLDEEGQRYLKIIDTSSRKMTSLLDDLLIFSRLGRQKMECAKVDMRKVAEDAWEELPKPAGRKIDFKVGKLPEAWCDAALAEQIWKRLLDNAIKFTTPKEMAKIEISGKTEPNRVVYSIKDNGVGFDMKLASKLFGIFQRLHTPEEFPGNGVGLAIVQRLVRRQSGDVWVEAVPKEGATVFFSLPLADAQEKK